MCVGGPYGMNVWQVGDSAQHNDSFIIEMSNGKTERLADRQDKKGFHFKLTNDYITWLLWRA
jgi:hypothetical protein